MPDPSTTERRTEYAIKLRLPGNDAPQYASRIAHWQWTDDPLRALRCPTMTTATIIAIEVLELAPDAFTVEAV